jgi:hypothetical protein
MVLDHQKIMLTKISQDKSLFKKELYKSAQWLSNEEFRELYRWVNENYGENHGDVISEVFNKNLSES